MKATKTFKIGECAVGGIVTVDITGKVILIKFLDWYTKETIITGSGLTTETNIRYQLHDFLNNSTSYYWTEKILKWIESKVELKNEFNF